MDWNAAIEKNREALKRILAELAAMAGLGGQFTFFPQKGALSQGAALAEKSKLSPTLPRHLYRAVLRLLRPAEAATRRLIIVAARGIVVPPPPPRSAWSFGASHLSRPSFGTPALQGRNRPLHRLRRSPSPASQGRIRRCGRPHPGSSPVHGGGGPRSGGGGVPLRTAMRPPTLPLFDPLRLPFRRRRPVASSVPRISVPGLTEPFSIPPPPSPDDPVDATRLSRRLAALASALDDLPGHARRLARWKAKRDALAAQDKNFDAAGMRKGGQQNLSRRHGVMRRISPLRPGRPSGWRAPGASGRFVHEVHDILDVTHGLAFWALESPDTS